MTEISAMTEFKQLARIMRGEYDILDDDCPDWEPKMSTEDKEMADDVKDEEKVLVRPLTTYYVPLKEGQGVRFVVWPTNLSIERVQRNNDTGRWDRYQSMSLTRRCVEFLATHAGSMLEQWDEVARQGGVLHDVNSPGGLRSRPGPARKKKDKPKPKTKRDELDEIKAGFEWA